MNRDTTLCRSFVRQAKEAFLQHPQVKHEWSIDADEDHCILSVPQENDAGFPLDVEVQPHGIVVTAGGAHVELDTGEDLDELAAAVLGLVRDLLSPTMRIREWLAGGKPHKWAFEVLDDGEWVTEESVGLLFFNIFGRRTEKVYQNTVLPVRDYPIREDDSQEGLTECLSGEGDASFGRTLFGGSRFVFWAITPCILLFLIVMPFLVPHWNSQIIGMLLAFWVIGIALILGMFNPVRFGWALRIVSGVVFVAYAAYLVAELMEGNGKLTMPGSRGEANPVNAILGLLVIGFPALMYTLSGRFTFKRGKEKGQPQVRP